MRALGSLTRQARGAGTIAMLALSALVLGAARAPAQQAGPRWQSEASVGVLVANSVGAHASIGASLPAGIYARIGGAIGADVLRGRGGARADVVARFLLDPFLQYRRAAYGGGGLSVRDEGGRARAYLLVTLGAEGPPRHGVLPALELSLGGGLRAGVVLRRAMAGRR